MSLGTWDDWCKSDPLEDYWRSQSYRSNMSGSYSRSGRNYMAMADSTNSATQAVEVATSLFPTRRRQTTTRLSNQSNYLNITAQTAPRQRKLYGHSLPPVPVSRPRSPSAEVQVPAHLTRSSLR